VIKNIYTISFTFILLISIILSSFNTNFKLNKKNKTSISFCNNSKYCPLYKKILFAENSSNKEFESLFYTNGIGHLLTISGLHLYSLMSICFIFFNILIYVFFKNKNFLIFKYSYFLSFLILVFYIYKIDVSLPRLRSLIMLVLLILSFKFYIFQKSVNNLIISASIIVLFFNYNNSSFFYSYISCLAIIISKRKNIFDISLLIFIFLIPVNLFFNGSINLLSLISNIIFVPFFSFIYFPIIIIYYFFLNLNIDFGFIIDSLTYYFLSVLELIKTDYFTFYLGFISNYKAIFLFFLILYFYYLFFYKVNKFIYFSFIVFTIFIINKNIKKETYDLKITIFELDKLKKSKASGDFIYLNFNNTKIIVDLGYINSKKIFRKLNSSGIKDIDYLILTHDHSDHIGGLYDIDKYLNVKKIIVSSFFNKNLLKEKNFSIACNKTKLIFSKDFELIFLNPNCSNTFLKDNETALSFLLKAKGYNYLFFSDLDKQKSIDNIIKDYNYSFDKTVVQYPHHCSSLLKLKADPYFAFCTRSKYLLKNIAKTNTYKIYSTALYGDINILQKDLNLTLSYTNKI